MGRFSGISQFHGTQTPSRIRDPPPLITTPDSNPSPHRPLALPAPGSLPGGCSSRQQRSPPTHPPRPQHFVASNGTPLALLVPKTTLARKAFETKEDTLKSFPYNAWITVSHSFSRWEKQNVGDMGPGYFTTCILAQGCLHGPKVTSMRPTNTKRNTRRNKQVTWHT